MPIAITSSAASAPAPSRVDGARQEARQAQNMAQRLRAQVDAAQHSADSEQRRADGLMQRLGDADRRSANAQQRAGAARSAMDATQLSRVQRMPEPPLAAFAGQAGYAAGQFLSVMA